jgi:TPR repeat protein
MKRWLIPCLAAAALAGGEAQDWDGDGLTGSADPEPLLSNLEETACWQLESPVLTWELDQERLSVVERSGEEVEAQVDLLRQAAQEVLEKTTTQDQRLTTTAGEADEGRFSLSVNPLQAIRRLVGGGSLLDAAAAGVRVGRGDRQDRTSADGFALLDRIERGRSESLTRVAERRTRLLRLQRITRVMRNPRLQLTLHLRNGGDLPLVAERPEVPVVAGNRVLGVAVPVDARDRERITVLPRRSQAVLLSVPVADSDFWTALGEGGESIRYPVETGAMRLYRAGTPDDDLIVRQRTIGGRTLPVRLLLPEGVVLERLAAPTGPDGAPTVRALLEAWNRDWRRTRPDAGGDLFLIDGAGLLVSAAGRTGSIADTGWQVEVSGRPLPPGSSLARPALGAVVVRWAAAQPLDEAALESLAAPAAQSPWLQAGVSAIRADRDLRSGKDPAAIADRLRSQLAGPMGKALDPAGGAVLRSALGEALRVAGQVDEARTAWQAAAAQGHGKSLLALAELGLDGAGRGDGLTLLRRAVAAGSPEAMVRLADLAPAEAPETLLGQAAEIGHPAALTRLGRLFETGDGLPRDRQQAAALYRQAAAGGDPMAMMRLGTLYQLGDGVERDPLQAARWFRAAATGQLPEIRP